MSNTNLNSGLKPMNPLENIRMAFEALWGNRLRSFLALLGIVIGVFAVTTMVSLGQMANAGITHDLESVAGKSVFVQPNFNSGETSDTAPVRESDMLALSRFPVSLVPQIFSTAQYESRPGERRSITLQGTPGDLPRLDPTNKLSRGRYFTDSEARSGATLVVLANSAARDLIPRGNPIGKTVRLFLNSGARLELTVVGVLEPPAGLFGGFGSSTVYVSNQLMWNNNTIKRNEYTFVTLFLKQGADSKNIQKLVTQLFESRYGKNKYQIQSTESFQGTLQSITGAIQALLAAIAALSLFVGGIGIMNIMLVSVTERTREIGLRKALGATAGMIRQQFLIEAVVLTLVGGLLGVLMAIGLLLLIAAVVPFFKVFVLSPATVILALTVSVVTGLFFGVWPAARAAKLDPIEALRFE